MKLLITGGCGFLGSNLAAEALARGDDLIVFDNLHRHGSTANLNWLRCLGKFQFTHGDIRNANDIRRVVESFEPQIVFHLAGQVAMTTSISNPRMDFEVNTFGTFNLLEAVRAYTPEATVIYSSTNKVYGDLEQYQYKELDTRYICIDLPNGFDEEVQLNFHSPYGCSKGAADQYMLDFARIYGLNTVVFRHSSMYGGRQFATYDQGWIGWFCQKALEIKKGILKEPFSISGSGKQVRDVIHADDMKALYFSAHDHIGRIRGNAFNIGGGMSNSLSLLELFTILEDIIGERLNYVKLAPRESDQRVFVADTRKITSQINWLPSVAVEIGIRRMFEWLEESS